MIAACSEWALERRSRALSAEPYQKQVLREFLYGEIAVGLLSFGGGSAGEWKQVFSLWPEGYRLVAIEAYRDGTGPGVAGCRSLDDYADQVYVVAEHVGVSGHLVGFSWGVAQPPSAWPLY